MGHKINGPAPPKAETAGLASRRTGRAGPTHPRPGLAGPRLAEASRVELAKLAPSQTELRQTTDHLSRLQTNTETLRAQLHRAVADKTIAEEQLAAVTTKVQDAEQAFNGAQDTILGLQEEL